MSIMNVCLVCFEPSPFNFRVSIKRKIKSLELAQSRRVFYNYYRENGIYIVEIAKIIVRLLRSNKYI